MEAGEGQSEKPHSNAELAKRGEELKRRPDDKRADIRSVRDAQRCVCTKGMATCGLGTDSPTGKRAI